MARTDDLESVRTVEEAAAAWLVRRDAGHWKASDQAELEQWLEASTAHMVAFIRLETAWQRTHRLKSLGGGAPSRAAPSTAQSRARRIRPATLLIAASVLFVAVLGVWYLSAPGSSYRTPVGGIASVPLADGSKIILNTDSRIRIAVTESERRIRLDHGEAFFSVRSDPQRPFIVSAGDKRVIAIGTAFSVRREEDDIRVIVTEGKVRIEQERSDDVLLPAGSVVRSDHDQLMLEHKPVAEVEEALSWRTGFLTFRETTLADAVAEFNRYNARPIVIRDPRIAAIRLSGRFEATQYEAFVRLLEESFPIEVTPEEAGIVLSSR
jgi:transmembrane sensor